MKTNYFPSVRFYHQAAIASDIAIAGSIALSFAMPVFPIGALAVGAVAAVFSANAHKQLEYWRRRDAFLYANPLFKLAAFDVPYDNTVSNSGDRLWYLGQGFQVTEAHAFRWHNFYRKNRVPLADAPIGYDPRIYGDGAESLQSVYMTEDSLATHIAVYGSTGSGKTRAGEVLLVNGINAGWSIILLDPKGDEAMTSMLASFAKWRGIPFHWLSIAHPDKSDTWNALATYESPIELRTRLYELLPQSGDEKFWTDTPASHAADACIGQAFLREWIIHLNNGDRSLRNKIPTIYAAFARALALANDAGREYPNIDDVDAAWEMEKGNTVNADPDSLDSSRYFTASFHTPSILKLYRYGVVDPKAVVGHFAKILFPHLMIGVDPETITELENVEDAEGNKKQKLDLKSVMNSPMPWSTNHHNPEWVQRLWEPVLRDITLVGKLQAIHHDLCQRYQPILDWANNPLEQRMRYCSSLETAVGAYRGRERLVGSDNPSVDLKKILSTQSILVISSDSLRDKNSADSFLKLMMSNLSAEAGAINANAAKKVKALVAVDEVSAVASDPLWLILTQARSTGISMLLMGQDRVGLEKALGSEEGARSYLNNCLCKIQLRCIDPEEAESASKEFGTVTIGELDKNINITGALGDAGNKHVGTFSASEHWTAKPVDVPLATPRQISQLPVAHAYVTIKGTTWLVVFPWVSVPEEYKVDFFALKGIKRTTPDYHFGDRAIEQQKRETVAA